jgi:hypothetical protein
MENNQKQAIVSWANSTIQQWEYEVLPSNSELAIHNFLCNYASLFLTKSPWEGIVVSKLKLGSTFETDFVVIEDQFSAGLSYHFIEIEIPETRLFTGPSKPIDRLNTALAQINSWKQWLSTHSEETRELLPSKDVRYGKPPRYKFSIIIGRRDALMSSPTEDRDRAWLSFQSGIEIRSFDSLTENAKFRPWQILGHLSQYPEEMESQLARPDWGAISHSEWVEFASGLRWLDGHLYEFHWETLLKLRNRHANSLHDLIDSDKELHGGADS